jgi:peptidoglycan/xylan/chitin deacetylase (PgdA/CDA1 family)
MLSDFFMKIQIRLSPFLSNFTILRSGAQLKLPPKTVVLTFDDGPNKAHSTTERLLTILKKHNVKAHFSLIGKNMVCYPEITRSIKSEGHQIANHGFEHTFVINKKDSWIIQDLNQWKEAYYSVLGQNTGGCKYYRPPYGVIQKKKTNILNSYNLQILPISFYAMDAESGPSRMSRVVDRIINGILAQNGGVIVLHDGKDCTIRLIKYNPFVMPVKTGIQNANGEH